MNGETPDPELPGTPHRKAWIRVAAVPALFFAVVLSLVVFNVREGPDNTFYLRVAMPEQDGSEGRGISQVVVSMDAHTLDGSITMGTQPVVTYEGDGTYRLDNVVLDAAGPWSLDFGLYLGGIEERVSFSFIVEE